MGRRIKILPQAQSKNVKDDYNSEPSEHVDLNLAENAAFESLAVEELQE